MRRGCLRCHRTVDHVSMVDAESRAESLLSSSLETSPTPDERQELAGGSLRSTKKKIEYEYEKRKGGVHAAAAASTSSTVLGMPGPSTRPPVSVQRMLSSIRMPPKPLKVSMRS